MELALRGYVITLRLERKRADEKKDTKAEEVSRLVSKTHHREEVDRQYLMSSGSRHGGSNTAPRL
jgi:hypothetical protein